MSEFKSNGKLLITAEYAVLDGAKALALPSVFGQDLQIKHSKSSGLTWHSFDHDQKLWFKAHFKIELQNLSIISSSDLKTAKRLKQILLAAINLGNIPNDRIENLDVTTKLEFNRLWGLGTSSTLINNIAQWLGLNPYELLKATFGGSGYDIACAQYNTPLTYQLVNNKPEVKPVDLNWHFKNEIYFVYLNQKQNSRDGIKNYRSKQLLTSSILSELNQITDSIADCTNRISFEQLIKTHDTIVSKLVDLIPVQNVLFSDFKGSVKSLGAWGGDFVMVTSDKDPSLYFKSKGYRTIVPFNKMIKH